MRKATRYAWTALLAAGLTACSQSDELGGQSTSAYSDSGVVLTSISSSAGNVGTRFDGDNGYWEEDDALGVFMMTADNSEILNDASNVAFTLSAGAGTNTGTFTNATGITLPEVAAHLFAYSPYSDSEDVIYETTYTLDLTDQSGSEVKAYDLMWADYSIEEEDIDNLDGNVDMDFEHMVAKVVIYVTTADGVTVNSAQIANLNAVGEFSLSAGEFDTESAGTIVPYDASTDDLIAYEAIVLPTTDMSAMTLKFVASTGYTYAWTASNSAITKFDAGYKYTFNIGLGTTPTTSGTGGSSSGGSNAITSITGTSDGFADNDSEVSDVAEVWSVAYEYDSSATIVDVDATDDLSTLLSTAASDGATSVALRFDSDTDYSTAFGTITVPDGVSTVMLICDNSNGQAAISLNGFKNYSPTIENLYIYNMDITGGGYSTSDGTTGTGFTYQATISGCIVVEDSKFSTMDNVFHLTNGDDVTMTEVTIDNCEFYDISCLLTLGSTADVTNGITLSNTTIGVTKSDLSGSSIISGGPSAATMTISDCTFEVAGSYTIRGNNGFAATITNCIIADMPESNFFYFVSDTGSSADNYYVTNSYASSNNLSGWSSFSDAGAWSAVFSSTQYSGSYTLSNTFTGSYGKAGDPRWYE